MNESQLKIITPSEKLEASSPSQSPRMELKSESDGSRENRENSEAKLTQRRVKWNK